MDEELSENAGLEPRRRKWPAILAAVAAFAAIMAGGSAYLMSKWSSLRTAGTEEAAAAFRDALDKSGGGPAYLEVSSDGAVEVHRELEGPAPVKLRVLHLLAWRAATSQLLHVDFPFWFVRLKMSATLNLGKLTTALAGDWGHLNLRISVNDLERRGPGLILNRTFSDGSRVLLWTE